MLVPVAVAPGAGLREVELEDGRVEVLHGQDVMVAVAAGAGGGAGSAHRVAHPVDARGIRARLLLVAGAQLTCFGWNVIVGMVRGQVAVALRAGNALVNRAANFASST